MKFNIKISGGLIFVAVLVVSSVSMLSALTTELTNQAAAAQLDVKEQTSYVTDVNVHFKTACFSLIIFTYCW